MSERPYVVGERSPDFSFAQRALARSCENSGMTDHDEGALARGLLFVLLACFALGVLLGINLGAGQ